MSDALNAAIEELEAQLVEQQQSVSDTKKMINALAKRMGRAPVYEDVEAAATASPSSLRADLFYGKGLATASREYLELRKRACTAEEILKGLEAGGFDFRTVDWKDEKGRLRNLSISLAKNTAIFHRLPNGSFGLAAWYSDVIAKKKDAKGKAGSGPETGPEGPVGE